MTVAALTSSREYNGNGVTTVFAAPFRYLSPTHLEVKRIAADGTVTTLAYGPDFSATAGTTDGGGLVTVTVAPVAGARLRIKRVTPRSQSTDYTTADDFPAEAHEAGLDRAMLVDQEQDTKIDDTAARALLVPEGETAPVLPAAAARAGYYMAFGVDGLPVMASGTGADAALRADLAADAGAGLVGGKRAITGAINVPASVRNRDLRYSPRDFSLTYGQGGDDTVALQACITRALADKRGVVLPAGETRIGAAGIQIPVTPDNTNSRFSMIGEGTRASILKPVTGLAARTLINVTTSALPTEANVHLADFSVECSAETKVHTPLKMTGIADFLLENLVLEYGDVNLDLLGSLIGAVRDCTLNSGNYGVRTRKSGALFCNAISFQDSRIKRNSTWGLDLGDANSIRIIGNAIEENGTAANTATGGLMIRSTCSDETGFGAIVSMGNHLENNLGHSAYVEAQTVTKRLFFTSIADRILSPETNRSLFIAGADDVMLQNLEAASPGNIVNVTASRLSVLGGIIATLTRATTYPAIILNGAFSALNEGNVQGDIHIGGGFKSYWSWVANGAGYSMYPDTINNALILEAYGAAVARLRLAMDLELGAGKVIKNNSLQVLGARGASLPADATDLATAIALVNAMKARGKATGGHGLWDD